MVDMADVTKAIDRKCGVGVRVLSSVALPCCPAALPFHPGYHTTVHRFMIMRLAMSAYVFFFRELCCK
jgi:hypothetical protein